MKGEPLVRLLLSKAIQYIGPLAYLLLLYDNQGYYYEVCSEIELFNLNIQLYVTTHANLISHNMY